MDFKRNLLLLKLAEMLQGRVDCSPDLQGADDRPLAVRWSSAPHKHQQGVVNYPNNHH